MISADSCSIQHRQGTSEEPIFVCAYLTATAKWFEWLWRFCLFCLTPGYLVQVCLERVMVNRVRITVLAVEFECSVPLMKALNALFMEWRVCLHCVFMEWRSCLSALQCVLCTFCSVLSWCIVLMYIWSSQNLSFDIYILMYSEFDVMYKCLLFVSIKQLYCKVCLNDGLWFFFSI